MLESSTAVASESGLTGTVPIVVSHGMVFPNRGKTGFAVWIRSNEGIFRHLGIDFAPPIGKTNGTMNRILSGPDIELLDGFREA
jgi:hypothetical protein